MPKADTAKYRPVKCYQCGAPMTACTFDDVWTMRIDGQQHEVPIYSVPCMRCEPCDLATTDAGSDEAIQHWYVEYCKKNGLWTSWRRFRRWVRSRFVRIYNRYQWWRTRHLRR